MLDTTEERHNMIYKLYLHVCKRHGNYASKIRKQDLYQEVADITGHNWKYIGIIVVRKLVEGPNLDNTNIEHLIADKK